MRAAVIALGLLAACSDEPSVNITTPLPDTTVVASVELRIEGHQLSDVTQTKIYVDLQPYTGELVDNSLPADCDDCMFVIGFAGTAITNGKHNVGAFFFAGEKQIAADSVSLVFQR